MTIAELEQLANENFPFRITLGLHKRSDQPGLSLVLKGDKRTTNQDGNYIWEDVWQQHEAVAPIEVPTQEWFTLHVSLKEGDVNGGHVVISTVDNSGSRVELINVTDYTHHPEDPNPMGLKTSTPSSYTPVVNCSVSCKKQPECPFKFCGTILPWHAIIRPTQRIQPQTAPLPSHEKSTANYPGNS